MREKGSGEALADGSRGFTMCRGARRQARRHIAGWARGDR